MTGLGRPAPPSSRTRLQSLKNQVSGVEVEALELKGPLGMEVEIKSMESGIEEGVQHHKFTFTSASSIGDRHVEGYKDKVGYGDGGEEGPPLPFLDLPAELRMQIYRECLMRDHNIKLSKKVKPKPKVVDSEEDEADVVGCSDSTSSVDSTPSSTQDSSVVDSNGSSSSLSDAASLIQTGEYSEGLNTALLRTCKQIYKEARDVLYSENAFDIDIFTAVNSLAALHQRSRRHIQHIELVIPNHTEILENFSEVVRLALRYCTGLKTFIIHTPFDLPGTPDPTVTSSNSTVYANGFDILRWLPQQCEVVMDLGRNPEIDAVVAKHLALAKMQDKVAYARRQLIAHDSSLVFTDEIKGQV